MSSFKNIFLVLLIAVVVSGCSSAKIRPMQVQNSDEASKIVVFRPSVLSAMFNDMIVAIDGNEVAVLQNEEFVSALVAPGTHNISVRGTAGFESDVTVNITSADTLYFEAAGSVNNVINFIPGSVLLKSNFYIEPANSFESSGLSEVSISYK